MTNFRRLSMDLLDKDLERLKKRIGGGTVARRGSCSLPILFYVTESPIFESVEIFICPNCEETVQVPKPS